jgi:hypothetical protein
MDAEIETDLTAEPLPRWKLDLLWVGPDTLRGYRALAAAPNRANISAMAASEDEDGRRTVMLAKMVGAGTITAADLDWAMSVDAVAGEAEDLARADDLLGAIRTFRDGLRRAPGADVYLMSMASCFVRLGARDVALRYLERAHAVNPENARIKRNLDGARAAMGIATTEPAKPAPAPPGRTAAVPGGWRRYTHPDGRFSVNLPNHWPQVASISDDASLSCRTTDGVMFEILNFTSGAPMAPHQLVDTIADGLEKYSAFEPGKSNGRVAGRQMFSFGGNDHCVEIVLKYREREYDITVAYVVCGDDRNAMYLALKTIDAKFDQARADFEMLLGSLETPWLRGTEPAVLTISRGAADPAPRPKVISQWGENPLSTKKKGGFWRRLFG